MSERRSDHRPGGVPATATTTATNTSDSATDPNQDEPYRKRRRIEWARLLRQVFAVDELRCHCGAERKIIAALTRNHSPEALRRYLEHIPRQGLPRVVGDPADPPPTAPARAPPQTELALGPAHPDTARHTADSGDAVDAMPDWDAHIAD